MVWCVKYSQSIASDIIRDVGVKCSILTDFPLSSEATAQLVTLTGRTQDVKPESHSITMEVGSIPGK